MQLTFTEVYKDNGCLEDKREKRISNNEDTRGDIGHQTLISSVGATNGIDKFSVTSPGNTTDYGDLTRDTNGGGNDAEDLIQGFFTEVRNPTSEYDRLCDFRSDGNAGDFGNLTDARKANGTGGSSQTRI